MPIKNAFDRMAGYIMRSALCTEPGGTEDPDARQAAGDEWDPYRILKRAWPDMIPFNIFFRNGEFLYFDQEFVKEDCPAGYVLFRALYYSYLQVPELKELIPPEQMKAEYGLSEKWDDWIREEELFLKSVRRREIYRQIWSWAEPAPDRIRVGREALLRASGADQKEILGKVHSVQLALLSELDRVCRELGLRYYAIHGTLLGAVRHKGFIPWDDDLDLAMKREDYEIFLEKAPEILEERCFLQTEDSDRACYFGGYAKLRDSSTTAMTWPELIHPCNQGIWLDIFPLDRCSGEEAERSSEQKRISFLQKILSFKYYPEGDGIPGRMSRSEKFRFRLLSKMVPGRLLRAELKKIYRNRPEDSEKRTILSCIYGNMPNRNLFEDDWFAEPMYLSFEDRKIPVPGEVRRILSDRYGSDYMTLPPAAKRKPGHPAYLDPEHSYLEADRFTVSEVLKDRRDGKK